MKAAAKILLLLITLSGVAADFKSAQAEPASYGSCLTSQVRSPESAPFILTHGHKTKHVAVFIHGLTDSPYYMRSISETLFNEGWNVVAILLAGHGTKVSDLTKVTLENWKNDVECGYQSAKILGEKVSLVGFSTGAALSIHAAQHPEKYQLESILLLSPAIHFKNDLGNYACVLRHFRTYDTDKPDTKPYRYGKNAANAICQLKLLQDEIEESGWGQGIHIPVFLAMSEADQTILPESVVAFSGTLHSRYEIIRYPSFLKIAHADLPLKQTNPYYSALEQNVINFIHAALD